jgi:hypothetical protein
MITTSHRFLMRWVVHPLIKQLRQGTTPKQLALTLALGGALGIFPILGSTTVLCLAVGAWLRLNQPILQILNYLLYPVHLALIPVFIRLGERLFSAPPITFSIYELLGFFKQDPLGFVQRFGMAGVHAVAAWTLVAPLILWIAYRALLPLLKKLAEAVGMEGDPS